MSGDSIPITRRRLGCLTVPAIASVRRAFSQGAPTGRTTLKLERDFRNAYLLAVSPDGKRVCLYFTETRQETFTLSSGRWLHKNAQRSRDTLSVLDLKTGAAVFSGTFRAKVYPASFFTDGERLYAETGSFLQNGELVTQQTVVDLPSGKTAERIAPIDSGTAFGFHAIREDTLLVQSYDQNLKRSVTLTQARWPTFGVIRRSAYATQEREEAGRDSEKYISADRNILAYGFDHTIVCRYTGDLSVIWTTKVAPEFIGAWRLAISADGRYVAAALTDSAFSNREKKYDVRVYEGEHGKEITRLAVSGTDGIAISPNGKLLAAAHTVRDKRGAVPTVFIYEVGTAVMLASVEHETVTSNPFMNASFGLHGIDFTSDGKYLITSAQDTRLWAIGDLIKTHA